MSAAAAAPASTPAVIDMRSDTVTKPTPAMRQAMFDAPVGDDVFGDDPTVNSLQAEVAALLGKEAGLFVPSGTMGNLLCLLVHVDQRGGEMILGDQSHIHYYEQGNHAQFGGIHSRVVKNAPDGTLDLDEVAHAIRKSGDDHLPATQLLCLENTQNRCGGRILTAEYMARAGALAKKHGIKLHVDGARLLNASEALKVDPKTLVAEADSVSLCLSKGLAAPIGSVIVGSAEFIRKARRLRKALGGGLRQVGILAAAGHLAVTEMVKGLATDHRHARDTAEGLRAVKGIVVPPIADVETNLLFVNTELNCTAAELSAELKQEGLSISATDTYTLRFVTHYHITDDDVKRTIEIVARVAAKHQK